MAARQMRLLLHAALLAAIARGGGGLGALRWRPGGAADEHAPARPRRSALLVAGRADAEEAARAAKRREQRAYASNALRHVFAGAASGAIGVTALAPVEVIRVNLMVDGGTWRTALQSLSRGWWRGNTADVLSAAPRVGITMASFAMYKRLLTVALREETTPQWAVFMAGALAGATATLATFPLDVVRTRMAVGCPIDGQWASVVDCMVSIARTEGCGALYGGLSATLVGVLPFNSIKLASYDFLRRSADAGDATSLPAATSAAFGAVAGVVAATSCFPLEMVRRRQMMGDHVGMPFHAAMVAIAQKEGARALLRGSGVNIVKVALSNSIGFALYETAKDTLGVDGRKPPWVKKREAAASRRGRGAGAGAGGRK